MKKIEVGEGSNFRWGSDSLSQYLAGAERNTRGFSIIEGSIYSYFYSLHSTFERAEAAIKVDSNDRLIVPRMLMIRAHSAILAAFRNCIAGQIVEAYPLMRAAIEDAWYALHIAVDPTPTSDEKCRARIWLNRTNNDEAKGQCKREFMIASVRATHQSVDSINAARLHKLYEETIERGAHPNEQGITMGIGSSSKSEKHHEFLVSILDYDPAKIIVTLRFLGAAGVGVLSVFGAMLPDRYVHLGLLNAVEALGRELDASMWKVAVKNIADSTGQTT